MTQTMRRPSAKLPCRYLLCSRDLVESVEGEFLQWDQRLLESLVKTKVYVCKEHAGLIELAAMGGHEVWLTEEGHVYIVDPDNALDSAFGGVQKGPGWG